MAALRRDILKCRPPAGLRVRAPALLAWPGPSLDLGRRLSSQLFSSGPVGRLASGFGVENMRVGTPSWEGDMPHRISAACPEGRCRLSATAGPVKAAPPPLTLHRAPAFTPGVGGPAGGGPSPCPRGQRRGPRGLLLALPTRPDVDRGRAPAPASVGGLITFTVTTPERRLVGAVTSLSGNPGSAPSAFVCLFEQQKCLSLPGTRRTVSSTSHACPVTWSESTEVRGQGPALALLGELGPAASPPQAPVPLGACDRPP